MQDFFWETEICICISYHSSTLKKQGYLHSYFAESNNFTILYMYI